MNWKYLPAAEATDGLFKARFLTAAFPFLPPDEQEVKQTTQKLHKRPSLVWEKLLLRLFSLYIEI